MIIIKEARQKLNLFVGVLTFPDTEKPERNVQTIHVSRKARTKDFGSVGSTLLGSINKGYGILSKPSIRELKFSENVGISFRFKFE